MGIRQLINENRKLVNVVVALMALSSVAFIIYYQAGANSSLDEGPAFYSVDDGKSFFKADSANIPPFTHDGKEAVQAIVYTVDGGKTRFVGYLMRFTPKGVQHIKDQRAKAAASGQPALPGQDPELQENTEIKRPGERTWIKISDMARAAEIMRVRSPTDPSKFADFVDP